MDLPTTRHDKPLATESLVETKIPSENSLQSAKSNLAESASFYVLLATIFLTPLSFLPSLYAPLDVVKTTLISFGVLVSLLILVIGLMKKKTLVFPKGTIVYATLAIVVSLVISTLLSANPAKSFFGQGFELNTASTLFLMFVLSFLVAKLVHKNQDRVFSVYAAIFVSFIVLVVFHIIRIFSGEDSLTLGILSSLNTTILGRWYDLGIFAGFIGLVSFFGIKFLTLGKGLKFLLYFILVICGLILLIVNFSLVWWSIAVITLTLGIFEFKSRTGTGTGLKKFFSRIAISSLVIFVVAVLCAWNQVGIRSAITEPIKLNFIDLVLPWQMTLDVTSGTIKESPLFGAGPNRFANQFLKFKPQELNPSPLWAAEFTSGFGTLPSFVTTQGIVGFLTWVIFFIIFIRYGSIILKRNTDPLKRFFITSSFLGSAFLWLLHLLYVPSSSIQFLAFIMTGLFFASLANEGLFIWRSVDPSVVSKTKKYTTIINIIIIIVLVLWLGSYFKSTMSISYFQSGIKELNIVGSADNAEIKFNKALSWKTSDVYYQALSQVNLVKISNIIQQVQASGVTQADPKIVEQISALVTQAIDYTTKAITLDPSNYYNHLAQARVLETATTMRIPNAYENAKISYTNAIAMNPFNPGLYLNLVRLEVSQNKLVEAQQLIGRALTLKPNYTEAIFLLSQIQVSNGQIKDAIISAQVATQINTSEPLLFFQLGLLHYNDKNYTEAVKALSKAVELNTQYANARYFLGLSHSRLGKNAEAIAQFEELTKTNPDNQEVRLILENLKEGKSPFADATPPIDNTPEKRKNLPVDEKQTETKTKKSQP